MEFWSGWDGMCTLERPVTAAAGLPYHGVCPDGSHLHQVFAGLDDLGRARYHLNLG